MRLFGVNMSRAAPPAATSPQAPGLISSSFGTTGSTANGGGSTHAPEQGGMHLPIPQTMEQDSLACSNCGAMLFTDKSHCSNCGHERGTIFDPWKGQTLPKSDQPDPEAHSSAWEGYRGTLPAKPTHTFGPSSAEDAATFYPQQPSMPYGPCRSTQATGKWTSEWPGTAPAYNYSRPPLTDMAEHPANNNLMQSSGGNTSSQQHPDQPTAAASPTVFDFGGQQY
jgi:hypothetical protein